MEQNYAASFRLVLRHEGGFVDHPDDPGGPTNKGVTQRVYDAFRAGRGQGKRSVRLIGMDEVEAIYREQYWSKAGCDDLPAGLDYAVFDFAVHSGVQKAIKDLQRAAGLPAAQVDGNVGLVTLGAVRKAGPLISPLCARRLVFLRSLKAWRTFGNGWGRRVAEVERTALTMAGGRHAPAPDTFAARPEAARAVPADTKQGTWLAKVAADPVAALPVAGGVLSALGQMEGPVAWAVAAVIVGGAIWLAVRAMKRDPV